MTIDLSSIFRISILQMNATLIKSFYFYILKKIYMLTKFLRRLLFVAQWLSHVWFFCDPRSCSLPGSSVHGISPERILELVSTSLSMGSSWPRDWTCVSCIGRQILYHWATREAQLCDLAEIKHLSHFSCKDGQPNSWRVLQNCWLLWPRMNVVWSWGDLIIDSGSRRPTS